MSYDIVIINDSFAAECRENNIDLGLILEEKSEIIPNIPKKSLDDIKHILLTDEDEPFKIESTTNNEIVFSHKENESVQVVMRDNVVFFKAGITNPWSILNITVHLMFEVDNIIRYDFQDSHWG